MKAPYKKAQLKLACEQVLHIPFSTREQRAKGDALRSSWLRRLARSFAARLKYGTCLKHA